ncbi:MAG: hypothetical protein R3A48_02260 [Polyangiales bacterium]
MSDDASRPLPPCGLYRTTTRLAEVPSGRLVYFHNHGDPGAGIYLPSSWRQNRARFEDRGILIPGDWWAATLDPLPAEGFYRVTRAFHCCEKQCATFEVDQLLQVGYTAEATPLVFVLRVVDGVLEVPEEGTIIDRARLGCMAPLKTPVSQTPDHSIH